MFPGIEDNYEDVIGKAMRGLSLNNIMLAERAGVPVGAVQEALEGHSDEHIIRKLAKALDLNGDCLLELANSAVIPAVDLPAGVILHNTAFPVPGYEAMTVNSYSVVSPEQPDQGIIIDTGARYRQILKERGANVASEWCVFLTHTHADHVVHFREIRQIASNSYAPEEEPYENASPVKEGDAYEFGPCRLTPIQTTGHSQGAMSYHLAGLDTPVVFVGDALFCYSIGKVGEGYDSALNQIRSKILNLPGETILCPGHGPPTTVEFEKNHNPFFA